jgi:hypothetical protein
VTSDGTYLYVCAKSNNLNVLHKIGTGENGTVPGRIYMSCKKSEPLNFHSWVCCNGKLYSKRSDDELGALYVMSTENFSDEKPIKLNFDSLTQGLNKQERSVFNTVNSTMPILTNGDDTSLFVVTLNLETR